MYYIPRSLMSRALGETSEQLFPHLIELTIQALPETVTVTIDVPVSRRLPSAATQPSGPAAPTAPGTQTVAVPLKFTRERDRWGILYRLDKPVRIEPDMVMFASTAVTVGNASWFTQGAELDAQPVNLVAA
jgi:hypothetical protein